VSVSAGALELLGTESWEGTSTRLTKHPSADSLPTEQGRRYGDARNSSINGNAMETAAAAAAVVVAAVELFFPYLVVLVSWFIL
jgi:hypothetical protein